jgi:membrane protein YdbS with pleckstrin-like domain
MLLIGTWVIALAKHQFGGGMQNEWLQVAMIISIAAIALLVVAYFPRYMKNAHQLSNIRQVLISVRSLRVLALEFALMILCNAISGGTMIGQPFWTSTAVAVIILTALIFYLLIIRAKKNGE